MATSTAARSAAADARRLGELLDKERVIERVIRLALSTDERDWPAARACFADQVLFDMTSLVGGEPATLTPEQITSGWEQGLAPIEHVHHQLGNFLVTVRGDEADAFCYGITLHQRRTASGRNTRMFVGTYDFRLTRMGDDWRISLFRFRAKFIDGNLELEKDDEPR